MHILDIAENSIRAGAKLVVIRIEYSGDVLRIEIEDDGCGMDAEAFRRAESPFCTTRTTRKVGLGLPLWKQLTEMCDGTFSIASQVGKGTKVSASFRRGHIDLPPMGDIVGTMQALLAANPERTDFRWEYAMDGREVTLDTREIRTALKGMPLDMPEIREWIGEYWREGMCEAQTQTKEHQWRCTL